MSAGTPDFTEFNVVPNQDRQYQFGPFLLSTKNRSLLRDGQRVHLTAKPFDTLLALVRKPGETVTKRELLDTVWGQTAVEENSLNQAISAIRKSLGERGGKHQYILTVPGVGYCFGAPVVTVGAGAAAPKENGGPRSRPFPHAMLVLRIGVGALATAALASAIWWHAPRGAGRLRTVSVITFRDYSPHQELNYFANGLRDGLISALVHTHGVEVTARMSSDQPRDAGLSPIEQARKLGADTVVSGSVSPAGNDFQVVVALVDGANGKYLWSKTYQATGADLPLIEQSAATGIARRLGASADVPAPGLPRNSEALELYLRACALARVRQAPQHHEAAELFERAIRLEPDFAPAYAAAANNSFIAIWNAAMKWDEAGARGIELAREAVHLDPALAEAHAALAQGWLDQWKWSEAESEISRAIELDPRSPLVWYRKAFTLAIHRRFQEAEQAIEIARTLDPAWDAPVGLLDEIYYYERRYNDGLELARQWRNVNPIFFDQMAARLEWLLGRPGRPGDAFIQDFVRAQRDPQGAYQDVIQRWHDSRLTAFEIACFTMVALRDRAATLHWLEKSLHDREPDIVSLAIDPSMDPVRDDPRAVAILRVLNLAD